MARGNCFPPYECAGKSPGRERYGIRYVVGVTRSAVLVMLGAGAAAGFALVARAVARRDTAPVDALSAGIVFPIAMVIPLMSSVARLMEEKHWISDIGGGYLAAITLASLSAAAYEAAS